MSSERDKPMADAGFRMMSLFLRVRDLFRKPVKMLHKVDIREGQTILDYGCGPGSYTIPLARIVGEKGKVYALDIHPLAAKSVESKARKEGLNNITTIISDRETGLHSESIDTVLLFDAIHNINDKQALLEELHRNLKPNGCLSILVDHMKLEDVIALAEKDGRFSLQAKDGHLLNFQRV